MSVCKEETKKILLIEDEESHIQLIKRSLAGLQFPVELKTAEFKSDIEEALHQFKPDLIICDYYLPETTGLNILINLREENPLLPFILISGYVGEEKAADVILEGANDFILKGNYNRLLLSVERELKNYERALQHQFRENKERSMTRTAFKMAGIGYCSYNPESDCWTLSEATMNILGTIYGPEICMNTFLEPLISEFDKAEITGIFTRILTGDEQQPVDVEFSLMHKERGFSRINMTGEFISDGHGGLQFTGCIRDITQILSKDRQLSTLTSNVPGIIQKYKLNADLSHEVVYVSDQVTELTGLTPEEIMADPDIYWTKVHPEYVDLVRDTMMESYINMSFWNVEYKGLDKEDKVIWIEGRGVPLKQPDGSVIWDTILLNVTEKKLAESELITQKNKYETLLRDGSDPIAVLCPRGTFKEYVLMSWVKEQYNIEEDYYIGVSPLRFVHKNDREAVRKAFMGLKEGQSSIIGPFRFMYPDGAWHWVESTVVNMCHREEIGGYVTTNRDVTEKKNREDQIRLLSSVASKTHDVILITDSEFKLRWVNSAFEKVSEYSSEELMGMPVPELMHMLEVPVGDLRALNAKISNRESFKEKVRITTRSGQVKWLSVTADPVSEGGIFAGFIGIIHDISEVIQKEQKLSSALKEKQYLLSEIHHRVKNNLAVVSGLLQLQAYDENKPEVQAALSKSVSRIQSMAEVHELLYKSEDFSDVEIGKEFEEKVRRLVEMTGGKRTVQFRTDITPVKLNMNQAVPFAMLSNELVELVTECVHRETDQVNLKMALRSDDEGCIQMNLTEYLGECESAEHIRNYYERLTEKDIVRVLGQQLDGSLEVEHGEYIVGIKLKFRSRNVRGSSSALRQKRGR